MRKLAALLLLFAVGCVGAAPDDGTGADNGAADSAHASSNPLLMPPAVTAYLKLHKWGMMHLQWHTVRQWDLLAPSDIAYAKKHGWTRSPIQEGQAGNGLQFLAMHRMMMQMIYGLYPSTKPLFAGWTTPPADPKDKQDPLPNGATTPFDNNMLMAIGELENNLGSFKTDDELGLYIETSLRPIAGRPDNRSTDKTTGIHNYIHNRFMDPKSPIDMGDPTVNLQNKRFWRLHGWIDQVWTKYRAQVGLTDDDPVYQAAMRKAMADMPMDSVGTLGGAQDDPPPPSLTKWFENNP